jgi:hypothetical protein
MLKEDLHCNPIKLKIKGKPVLRKSLLTEKGVLRLKRTINTLSQFYNNEFADAEELATDVLQGIEVNHQLMEYAEDLDEEIAQIERELARLHEDYRLLDALPQEECQSYEFSDPSLHDRIQQHSSLLSRLRDARRVSRSYGSNGSLSRSELEDEGQLRFPHNP